MIDYGKELQKAYDDGYKDRDAEIVRCKDCKWYDIHKEYCLMYGYEPDGSWFCADGEKRNDSD